ncbi:MAG: crotonobetainyl-CoA:carnitine CoA-transferase CaiB-like acyl-CoA transferase [Candidatus Azotimanducaceae bacterium]|jgi:crotonobetainyl-CoA:carnitine CoA-transferase CaiB-like acyl-CoA transferase
MSRPLDGLKVLDFSHVLAGPFATRVLGDLGADVVKVNSESRAVTTNSAEHPYYIMWNRNKRALSLNMADAEGKKICGELARQADVVIDNFSVGVLDRWGVGYDEVSADNPGVIYAQMSGMGEGGPWSDFVTYAPTIHALSGLTSLTGVPGREDIGLGFSYNDHASGLHGAVAVLAALAARSQTGKGQRIEVSQFEVGVNFAGPSLLDFFANDQKAEAMGNDLPYDAVAPHNVYPCRTVAEPTTVQERWIAIACMTDEQWRKLVVLMDNPEWAVQSNYNTAAGRVADKAIIDARIAEWTKSQDEYELMARCQQAGVPAGVVQDGRDLCERDPQLSEGGFQVKIPDPHPVVGQTWADRLPLRFSKTPVDDYQRVRMLGEDNEAILADWLNMPAEEVRIKQEQGTLK